MSAVNTRQFRALVVAFRLMTYDLSIQVICLRAMRQNYLMVPRPRRTSLVRGGPIISRVCQASIRPRRNSIHHLLERGLYPLARPWARC